MGPERVVVSSPAASPGQQSGETCSAEICGRTPRADEPMACMLSCFPPGGVRAIDVVQRRYCCCLLLPPTGSTRLTLFVLCTPRRRPSRQCRTAFAERRPHPHSNGLGGLAGITYPFLKLLRECVSKKQNAWLFSEPGPGLSVAFVAAPWPPTRRVGGGHPNRQDTSIARTD